jgi:hypothetical protein
LIAAAFVLTACVFAADFATAPGIDIGVPNVVSVLIVSFAGSPRLARVGTWTVSLPTVAGFLRHPLAGLPAAMLPDRIIALAVIWTTASIVQRLRATTQRLEASTRGLTDLQHALDQFTTSPSGCSRQLCSANRRRWRVSVKWPRSSRTR